MESYDKPVPDIDKFRNMLNTKQLRKIVEYELELIKRQEIIGSKIDRVGEKIDRVAEKIDRVAEKVDKTREELGEKIDGLRADIKTSVEERLRIIEEDIRKIKAKLGMI